MVKFHTVLLEFETSVELLMLLCAVFRYPRSYEYLASRVTKYSLAFEFRGQLESLAVFHCNGGTAENSGHYKVSGLIIDGAPDPYFHGLLAYFDTNL